LFIILTIVRAVPGFWNMVSVFLTAPRRVVFAPRPTRRCAYKTNFGLFHDADKRYTQTQISRMRRASNTNACCERAVVQNTSHYEIRTF
ncbi:unnamed protein product, partial [Pylaiella littoralis]